MIKLLFYKNKYFEAIFFFFFSLNNLTSDLQRPTWGKKSDANEEINVSVLDNGVNVIVKGA